MPNLTARLLRYGTRKKPRHRGDIGMVGDIERNPCSYRVAERDRHAQVHRATMEFELPWAKLIDVPEVAGHSNNGATDDSARYRPY